MILYPGNSCSTMFTMSPSQVYQFSFSFAFGPEGLVDFSLVHKFTSGMDFLNVDAETLNRDRLSHRLNLQVVSLGNFEK